jgi:general secretion pathway protein N
MITPPAAFIVVAAVLVMLGTITPSLASPRDINRAPAGNPLWGVPLQMLSATRDRPIFSPSRRPPTPPAVALTPLPQPAPKAKDPEPERPALAILGTVVGRGDGIGIFVEEASKGVLRLHAGQAYGTWLLRTVGRREAKFERGETTATLTLPAPREALPVGSAGGGPPSINPAAATVASVAASPALLPERRRRD